MLGITRPSMLISYRLEFFVQLLAVNIEGGHDAITRQRMVTETLLVFQINIGEAWPPTFAFPASHKTMGRLCAHTHTPTGRPRGSGRLAPHINPTTTEQSRARIAQLPDNYPTTTRQLPNKFAHV